jgi:hypothetical protein
MRVWTRSWDCVGGAAVEELDRRGGGHLELCLAVAWVGRLDAPMIVLGCGFGGQLRKVDSSVLRNQIPYNENK